MPEIADIILRAGRSAVELAFFILLPTMILMLSLMRWLEARGWLGRFVALLTPVLRPFGIPGLGVLAMVQILLVSFAAPVATLTMMDQQGEAERRLAATLAMALVLAQANVVFPLAVLGLNVPATLLLSLAAGLLAGALTYYGFGRHLSLAARKAEAQEGGQEVAGRSLLQVINHAGAEAFKITLNALPILVLAVVLVAALRAFGAVGLLEGLLAPLFHLLDLPAASALPVISKYVAGGTAMMGVSTDYLAQGLISVGDLNRLAGFLINPLDLVGVAVFVSAGPAVARVLRPALYAAMVAIAVRATAHLILF